MRPRIDPKDVPKEIRRQLPVIDESTFRDHFCAECPYYAGRVNQVAHCMLKNCSWESEREIFSPVLKKMIPILEGDFRRISQRYEEAKKKKELILQMFTHEMKEDRKKEDPCKRCSYRTHAPCIGFCYLQMTANPTDEKTENKERRRPYERYYPHGPSDKRSKL